MPTRRIGDVPQTCFHPEHNPPQYQVFPPGVYEHACPSCGAVVRFTVQRVTCRTHREWVLPHGLTNRKPSVDAAPRAYMYGAFGSVTALY